VKLVGVVTPLVVLLITMHIGEDGSFSLKDQVKPARLQINGRLSSPVEEEDEEL